MLVCYAAFSYLICRPRREGLMFVKAVLLLRTTFMKNLKISNYSFYKKICYICCETIQNIHRNDG